jgi:hypothetical protein
MSLYHRAFWMTCIIVHPVTTIVHRMRATTEMALAEASVAAEMVEPRPPPPAADVGREACLASSARLVASGKGRGL